MDRPTEVLPVDDLDALHEPSPLIGEPIDALIFIAFHVFIGQEDVELLLEGRGERLIQGCGHSTLEFIQSDARLTRTGHNLNGDPAEFCATHTTNSS